MAAPALADGYGGGGGEDLDECSERHSVRHFDGAVRAIFEIFGTDPPHDAGDEDGAAVAKDLKTRVCLEELLGLQAERLRGRQAKEAARQQEYLERSQRVFRERLDIASAALAGEAEARRRAEAELEVCRGKVAQLEQTLEEQQRKPSQQERQELLQLQVLQQQQQLQQRPQQPRQQQQQEQEKPRPQQPRQQQPRQQHQQQPPQRQLSRDLAKRQLPSQERPKQPQHSRQQPEHGQPEHMARQQRSSSQSVLDQTWPPRARHSARSSAGAASSAEGWGRHSSSMARLSETRLGREELAAPILARSASTGVPAAEPPGGSAAPRTSGGSRPGAATAYARGSSCDAAATGAAGGGPGEDELGRPMAQVRVPALGG